MRRLSVDDERREEKTLLPPEGARERGDEELLPSSCSSGGCGCFIVEGQICRCCCLGEGSGSLGDPGCGSCCLLGCESLGEGSSVVLGGVTGAAQ